ncbi:MAG: DUF3810 domain-containing protein [Cellulophaga sp.]
MKNKIKNGLAIALIPQILLVKWLGNYPEFIEKYYSTGIYPIISGFFRTIFGWVSFSIGDLIYLSLLLIALGYFFLNRGLILRKPKLLFRNIAVVLSVAYFTFHLLWGFNYYRVPIAQKLELKETHTNEELISFVEKLLEKTNSAHFSITADSTKMVQIPYNKEVTFNKAIEGYQVLEKSMPFLKYERQSLKKSLFSTTLTYMGYGGYLNPFTNEAQVNGKIPDFRYPVVSCHEMGHQVGYSAENETNFVGYLAAVNNEDIYFKYAAYAYALRYCLGDIKRRDETAFQVLFSQLNIGVKKNYQEVSNFWMAHENPLEPIFKSIFNSFLKANNQKKGIDSYNQVVSLLVTYHLEHPL